MSKNIYEIRQCDYCGEEYQLVRPSPFMADAGAVMCKPCWDTTKEEYMNSTGELIPGFEDGPGYDNIDSLKAPNTVPSKYNPDYKMHMLAKHGCIRCNREFIVSAKQAEEAKEIMCPYCGSMYVEATAYMEDRERLEDLGCMGIAHLESEDR